MSFPPLSPGWPASPLPLPAAGKDCNNEHDNVDDDYDDDEYDGQGCTILETLETCFQRLLNSCSHIWLAGSKA